MADRNPTDCGLDPAFPPDADHIVEASVLGFVLSEHPTHLTMRELVLAMNQDRDCVAGDEIERAIRELVGAGLLQVAAGLVVPTRAALYFDTLGVD
jgi:hypothetical protein